MRFPWKAGVSLVIALTVLSAIPLPGAATHTGNVVSAGTTVADNNLVLNVNRYQGYTFTLATGDSITYGIQVVTPALYDFDVYFFDAAGLALYRADPPQTSSALLARENGYQFGGTFTAAAGAITVIVDNVNGTGATPTSQVTVQVALTRNGAPTDFFGGILALGIALCVGVIAIIVIVIFVIVYLVTRGNKPPPMPPAPPPYMPPQQPWPPPQPPQGPPPGQGP